ncbi:MAG: hypothetical protein KatS3mg122_2091 [Caldimonas sp.]|nr:MAG: hypothetical protein KatS3mg122_2091 [Caldimonas sp.]
MRTRWARLVDHGGTHQPVLPARTRKGSFQGRHGRGDASRTAEPAQVRCRVAGAVGGLPGLAGHLAARPDAERPRKRRRKRTRPILQPISRWRGLTGGHARRLGLGVPLVRGRHAHPSSRALSPRDRRLAGPRAGGEAHGPGPAIRAVPLLPPAPGAGLGRRAPGAYLPVPRVRAGGRRGRRHGRVGAGRGLAAPKAAAGAFDREPRRHRRPRRWRVAPWRFPVLASAAGARSDPAVARAGPAGAGAGGRRPTSA